MENFQPQFILVDAHNFLHRNYHALPKLTTSTGLEVGALYGFLRWLLKMLKEHQPTYVAVCFDSPGGCTRRKSLLPTYKGTRKKPDDALILQLNLARDLVSKIGLSVVAKEGIEADDLMAYLAKNAAKQDISCALATTDKDVYQCLTDKIFLWPAGGKDGFKGPEYAKEKFNVTTEFLPDYFSIVGDSADNIPGVMGVGPKSAVDLINRFGHLEDIIRAAHNDNPDIKPTLTSKIIAHEGEAILSKQLVLLDENLDIDFDISNFFVKTPAPQELEKLFKEYEFKNLPYFSVNSIEKNNITREKPNIKEIPIREVLEKAVNEDKVFVYASEDYVVVSCNENEVAMELLANLTPLDTIQLAQIINNESIEKIGYDFKSTLNELNFNCQGNIINVFDITLARYLINPSVDLSADAACKRYCSIEFDSLEVEDRLGIYASCSWKLREILLNTLKDQNLYEVYSTLEIPLMVLLSEIERNGFLVDKPFLEEFKEELSQEISRLQSEINGIAKYPVNVNSPKQLATLLFEEMHIPATRKTKTGYSTDESVLEEIAQTYPIASFILDYRTNAKLKSTYVDNLLSGADEKSRVHPFLDQMGTVTGRLSCSNPNLQNLPARTQKGRLLRRAFCAEKGNILLSIDYSQIDLRVLAHESKDPVLVQSFLEGGDIHTQTASQVFGVMPLMVTPEMRSSAKAINFGIIYGQGPMGLSQALNISMREAKEYIDSYFKHFKVVREWIDANIVAAKQNGYVKTMFGHIRYLPEFTMGVGSLTSFAQRAAINTIVQGGSADIIKKAMVDIFKKYHNLDLKMLMQIHDELIFELPQNENTDKICNDVRNIMEKAVALRVPLLTTSKQGTNLYDMQKMVL